MDNRATPPSVAGASACPHAGAAARPLPSSSEAAPAPHLAAEALFCSPLQPSASPTAQDIRTAVERLLANPTAAVALRGEVAHIYGSAPELATARMCWCLTTIRAVYGLGAGGEERS